MANIDVIIPAFNEEQSIPLVLNDIPDFVRQIIVVNNNSIDRTAIAAAESGAHVVDQPDQGYGNACLKGIETLKSLDTPPEIVVFLDADYSDHPEEMNRLVEPILYGDVDFVVGSRALGEREKGSMMPQQRFGNWLATFMVKLLYKRKITDLGPFRAIKFQQLMDLEMKDQTFGWTIEMQLKAIKKNYKYQEVPVSYRKRIGRSKITGTVKGTILAGYKIIGTIINLRHKS